MTLVVTPPGADANKIKPTLSSTGIGNKKETLPSELGLRPQPNLKNVIGGGYYRPSRTPISIDVRDWIGTPF